LQANLGESTMTAIDDASLKPLVLLGGYNAQELWPTVNIVLLSWFLYVFCPKWKHTPALSLVAPILHAVIYTLGVISLIMAGDDDAAEIDFSSLAGVVEMFKDPSGVFIGWHHYIVYDALVARWMILDSQERNISNAMHVVAMIPCLFLSFVFGPTGYLAYLIVRTTLLLPKNYGNKKGE